MGGIIEAAVAIGAAVSATAAAATVADIALTVAVTGAALSVVGVATKNKVLTDVGLGLGIAGGVVGIGASLAGVGAMTAGEAMTSIGDFFSGAAPATALGEAPSVATAAEGVTASGWEAPAPIDAASQGAVTPGMQAVPEGGLVNQPATQVASAELTPSTMTDVTQQAPGSQAPAPPSTEAPQAPAAPQAPPAPGASAPGSVTAYSGTGVDPLSGLQAPQPNDVQNWWNKLDPSTKAMLALTGGQALAGAAGGIFQAMSASDRLQLDELINQQRQNQVQYLNANNQYAPSLNFKSATSGPAGKGIINQPTR